jgi:hypothetical protein
MSARDISAHAEMGRSSLSKTLYGAGWKVGEGAVRDLSQPLNATTEKVQDMEAQVSATAICMNIIMSTKGK